MPRKKNPTKKEIADEVIVYKKTGYYKKGKNQAKTTYDYYEASWEVPKDYLPQGAKRRRLTARGATKEEAKWALVSQITEFYKDAETHWLRTNARGASLDAYVSEKWVKKLRAEDISETMKRRHMENYRNHIKPFIGNRSLTTITKEEIEHLLTHQLRLNRNIPTHATKTGERTVKGLSDATRKNVSSTLSKLFRAITEDKLIPENPIKYVKKIKPKQKPEDIEVHIKQVTAMMKKIEKSPDYCRYLLQFLGLRKAERLGLTWDRVKNLNTQNPSIVISQQLARHDTPNYDFSFRKKGDENISGWYIKGQTKTAKVREIPLPKNFAKAMREHKKRWEANKKEWEPVRKKQLKAYAEWEANGKKGDKPSVKPPIGMENMVFLKPDGGMITFKQDGDDWNRLLEKHKVEPFRPHLMRHITASLLAESDIQISEVVLKSILGHETTAMTYYYTKILAKNMKKAMGVYEKSLNIFNS